MKVCKTINIACDIRNIGIMAHVDAGKTTLSESVLYLANEISCMGNIDDGTTQLDFMPLVSYQ